MDDSGFKSTRLSLMIVSIGIIIFILGGGTVNSANIFFGSIDLKETWQVKWVTVLIYTYLLWRYWLYKDDVMGNFGEEFKKYFYKSNDYVNLSLKIIAENLSKSNQERYKHAIRKYSDDVIHRERISPPLTSRMVDRYYLPPILDNHLYPKFLWLLYRNEDVIPDTLRQDIKFDSVHYGHETTTIINIVSLQFILLELIVLSKMIFTRRSFSDFILPIPIALYTAYLLLTHS